MDGERLREAAGAFLNHVREAAEWPTPGIGCDGKCKEADALRAALTEAPPSESGALQEALDVERLAQAMSSRKWGWLGWTDKGGNDARRQEAFRNAAEEVAAEYAALSREEATSE